jgi:hypothetical protein
VPQLPDRVIGRKLSRAHLLKKLSYGFGIQKGRSVILQPNQVSTQRSV